MSQKSLLANHARTLFVEHAGQALAELVNSAKQLLQELARQAGSARDMQERRDAYNAFDKHGAAWAKAALAAWNHAVSATPTPPTATDFSESSKLELLDDAAMEHKIMASRLGLRLLDLTSWELNDLRLRIQHLENTQELHKQDIFRPEVLAHHLVEQWAQAGLSTFAWLAVQDLMQKALSAHLLGTYRATNEFLIQQGVMADIDLRALVKRTPAATGAAANNAPAKDPAEQANAEPHAALGPMRSTNNPMARAFNDGGNSPHRGGLSAGSSGSGAAAQGRPFVPNAKPSSPARQNQAAAGAHLFTTVNADVGLNQGVFDETRLQTAASPLLRARSKAQGVMGHLKRLLSNQVAGFEDTKALQASPKLAQAMARVENQAAQQTWFAQTQGDGQAQLVAAAGALRDITSTLKQAASTTSEKAIIEIVALMFQSILAEDRIAPAIRLWFARLQMPVLRVAIAEPEFFDSLQHPARRLIDRMGSCVLGFNVTVSGGAMEIEIKRIVQVIEQYPETGHRVFQLVYEEFEKFLSKFLSEQGSTARVVSVAQQVEQKETMTIQFTIEMRKMLNDIPVREEIREFLFKVWAEVLALAAMKNGPQHEETVKLKRAASDLVWAASAKPNRSDRARVIADLPQLLQQLRLGMSILGLSIAAQDMHLRIISDTLADAFMSKTDVISIERVEAMAQRLANLEEYLSDEDVGELPLDADSLVTMMGIEVTDIVVITDGGSQPTDAMRAWVQELQLGTWFSMEYCGKISQVQFAWCSERKQLHLFASADGHSFLIQASRLAAYLQAGLLVPTEEEALTVRATREALAKLDADPERLLGTS